MYSYASQNFSFPAANNGFTCKCFLKSNMQLESELPEVGKWL